MNSKKIILLSALLVLAGCKASVTSDEEPVVKPFADISYSATPLAGTVYGQAWTAKTAYARYLSASDQLVLEISSEDIPYACDQSLNRTIPHLRVYIPAKYDKGMEFRPYGTDQLVFLSNSQTTYTANKSGIRIDQLTNTGFIASVYANETDKSGATSEINGVLNVIDCTKVTKLSDWRQLEGNYRLYSFDGYIQDNRAAQIYLDAGSFYDVVTQTNLKSVVFPLYTSVVNNTYEYFGALDGRGVSAITRGPNQTMYEYDYSGPVRYKGSNVQLILKLMVIKDYDQVRIDYTFEVPGAIPSTSHKMVLKK